MKVLRYALYRYAWLASLALLALSLQAAGPYLAPTNPPAAASFAWDMAPGVTWSFYWGTDGSRLYNQKVTGLVTNFATLTNMVRGATYFVAVTAVDGNGLESAFSSEVTVTPRSPPNIPTGMKPPILLSLQVKPMNGPTWADAGASWYWDPAETNDVFRLAISGGSLAAATASAGKAKQPGMRTRARPPLPPLPEAQ